MVFRAVNLRYPRAENTRLGIERRNLYRKDLLHFTRDVCNERITLWVSKVLKTLNRRRSRYFPRRLQQQLKAARSAAWNEPF
jgi:hypothetical protein